MFKFLIIKAVKLHTESEAGVQKASLVQIRDHRKLLCTEENLLSSNKFSFFFP